MVYNISKSIGYDGIQFQSITQSNLIIIGNSNGDLKMPEIINEYGIIHNPEWN